MMNVTYKLGRLVLSNNGGPRAYSRYQAPIWAWLLYAGGKRCHVCSTLSIISGMCMIKAIQTSDPCTCWSEIS